MKFHAIACYALKTYLSFDYLLKFENTAVVFRILFTLSFTKFENLNLSTIDITFLIIHFLAAMRNHVLKDE